MKRDVFDVVIVGGGPAGCATAIVLAQKKFRVALIEKSNYDRARIGETLLPAARAPLEQLGLWEQFLASEHEPSPSTLSAWGDDELYENDFIFNPYGNGWHLDRPRFDRELAASAEECGAKIFRNARVTGFEGDAARWRIEFVCDGKTETVESAFLVDASGRARFVTRPLGVSCTELDHLVGLVRFFRGTGDNDNRTMVEASRDGWWYSAWLPDTRLVVAYMTDADLIVEGHARDEEWNARLGEARHTRRRAGKGQTASTLSIWSANSYLLEYVAGERWLAVGEAAMAIDPLSSQGIYNALESGRRAGDALGKWFEDKEQGLEKYADWLNTRFDSYLQNRAKYYARETRWADSLFWQRRQTINEYRERTRG